MVKRESKKEDFTRRLIEACEGANLTGRGRNKTLADGLKRQGFPVSTPGVWKWFNGQSIPDSQNIMALSKILDVRAEWLEYGIGHMTDGGLEQTATVRVDGYKVEVLDAEASAGAGRIASSEVEETISSVVFTTDEANAIFGNRPSSSIKVITVTGDSMSGTIETGDYIFVDISTDFFDTDGIYVFMYKKNLFVKRLQMTEDCLLVKSDNPKYADWKIGETNEQYLKVLGRVLYSNTMKRYV